MAKFLHKVRLMLCVWGFHKKKMFVGGYRCIWCGKYCGGYVPEPWKRTNKKAELNHGE